MCYVKLHVEGLRVMVHGRGVQHLAIQRGVLHTTQAFVRIGRGNQIWSWVLPHHCAWLRRAGARLLRARVGRSVGCRACRGWTARGHVSERVPKERSD